MSEKKPKIPAWLEKRQTTLAERRVATMKEKGQAEFYKLEEGVTKILIDASKEPREETGDFGMKTILRVQIDGKEWDLSCSDSLTKKIYNALQLGINPLTIIRVGEEKQTRYSIAELKKRKNAS